MQNLFRKTSSLEPNSTERRRFLKGLATFAIAASPVYGYGHYVEADNLQLVEFDFKPKHISNPTSTIKIGFLSDLHCSSAESTARAHRAAKMLMAEKPDLVILGGDYITYYNGDWADDCADALAPVANAPLGALAVFGNHDAKSLQTGLITREMKRVGIRTLVNESVPIPMPNGKEVWIIGLHDYIESVPDVDTALQYVPADATKILVVHEPDYALISPPGFSLQLSGHSHAGQVRLFGKPIFTPKRAQEYTQGLEHCWKHAIYTSRGVGMVPPEFRINCRPEVTLINFSV